MDSMDDKQPEKVVDHGHGWTNSKRSGLEAVAGNSKV